MIYVKTGLEVIGLLAFGLGIAAMLARFAIERSFERQTSKWPDY